MNLFHFHLNTLTTVNEKKLKKFLLQNEPSLQRGPIMNSAILDDPSHENRMSFDDLEQVYKNISRRNILNKVRNVSNMSFNQLIK